ncbi:hypothetical protein HJB51_28955 [Rhizobium lentis]|uniref:hypothetical protein n=1 Tax=Rhizobium lentis TaxID=1138194 RepID=UPI001C83A896|nr:hypothetical protein [Rhizobium lentis]MBX5111962.1 hypothetical protein [Rhizobium lentis]
MSGLAAAYIVVEPDGRVRNIIRGFVQTPDHGLIERTEALRHVRLGYVYNADLDDFVDPSASTVA